MRLMQAAPLLASALIISFGIGFARPVVSATASAPAGRVRIVTEFLPSRDGYRFRNPAPRPSDDPLTRVTTEQCGGMAFGAVDHYRSGCGTPESLSARDRFLRTRSAVSIASNGWRFVAWSTLPDLPKGRIPGVSTLTRRSELPRLEAALSEGPVPVGLVRSQTPAEVRLDHQVVAYGLIRDGSRVVVRVYDPDQPGADDVRLIFRVDDPDGRISERRGDFEVASWRGLFVEDYAPVTPPSATR